MFGHPRIYFGESERLSATIQEPEHLISAVASIHRLTLNTPPSSTTSGATTPTAIP